MPIAQERELEKAAAKLSKSGKLRRKVGESLQAAKDRFVFGIMRKTGWKPEREEMKVDPKHPETHPDFERSVAVGRSNINDLKFENDAQRRDYDKAVAANPNNVPGLPPYYPPLEIKICGIPGLGEAKRIYLPCGHFECRITAKKIGVVYSCSEGHYYRKQIVDGAEHISRSRIFN